MKFSGKVGNGPVNKRLTFGGDLDHRLDTGIVSAFDTVERYRKGINRLLRAVAGIAIGLGTMMSLHHWPTTDSGTDIAALVRHALAEVCGVPVLLVYICFLYCFLGSLKGSVLVLPIECETCRFSCWSWHGCVVTLVMWFTSSALVTKHCTLVSVTWQ